MALRLALAQINTTVGDLAGNRDKILARVEEARGEQVDIVISPELINMILQQYKFGLQKSHGESFPWLFKML